MSNAALPQVDQFGFVAWDDLWEAEQNPTFNATYDQVSKWYKDAYLLATDKPGVRVPETFQHSLHYVQGRMKAGTNGFLGNFPMSYAFPRFDTLEDYKRLLGHNRTANRLGKLLQVQYFNMRSAWETNEYFVTYSRRDKFLQFLEKLKDAFGDEELQDLKEKEGDRAVLDALDDMIKALKDKTNKTGTLPDNVPKYIEPTKQTSFLSGIATMKTLIERWWTPLQKPGTGEWPKEFPPNWVQLTLNADDEPSMEGTDFQEDW